jgi:hypothetical protein
MQRLTSLSLITLGVLAWWATPSLARITMSDAAATHAYLEARLNLRRAKVAAEPAELAAIEALQAQVNAGCPGVLVGAPPHVKEEKLSESDREITTELLVVGLGASEHVEHPADARFARTVRRLRWSNPKLTRLLRSLAVEQAEQSAIEFPNLCADLQFWVASRYTAVSPGTKRFLHRLSVVASTTVIESEPHEAPFAGLFNLNALVARRLKPYEDHRDQLLARKALTVEGTLFDHSRKPVIEAVDRVYVALGYSRQPAA